MIWLDHNTMVVAGATALLGCSSGVAGCLLLLRGRALMGDALGHATLPGIAIAYLISVWMGGSGKEPWILLTGAGIGALLGVAAVSLVRRGARTSDETAMAIVLGTFFGIGAALLTVIQASPSGNQAGLATFVTGHAASMVTGDLQAASVIAAVSLVTVALLSKELRMLCFDDAFARSIGRPASMLDALTLLIVTAIVVAGLQAVGLILVLALLVIPAAAARLCTERFDLMLGVAAAVGAASAVTGTLASGFDTKLPTGPCIVLASAAYFLVALVVGPSRGLLSRRRAVVARGAVQ